MRRVWATVVAVWATLAIVAALAWTHQPPPRPLAQPAATTLVVKGKNGTTQRLVVVGTDRERGAARDHPDLAGARRMIRPAPPRSLPRDGHRLHASR